MSESEYTRIFAKRLKLYLDHYGISQADLAKRLGVGTSSVSNWVNGVKTPRPKKVDMMCEIFHCDRSDFLKDTDEIEDKYYIDPETAAIAQEIKESRELSALFSVQRSMKPEDLQTVYQMALALKRKEEGK